MLVSTRGRYALRVMVDLAQHQSQGPIPMKDVAQRQQISLKYLEKILPVLSKNGYIVGTHGKGGGYQLPGPRGVPSGGCPSAHRGGFGPGGLPGGGGGPLPAAGHLPHPFPVV